MENTRPSRSRVRTVAERNGVSESTVWRLIRAGRLTAHRVGRRITLIDDAEVDRLFGGAPQTFESPNMVAKRVARAEVT